MYNSQCSRLYLPLPASEDAVSTSEVLLCPLSDADDAIESNARVFAWIGKIERLFESAYARLLIKRDEAEAALKIRVAQFEQK